MATIFRHKPLGAIETLPWVIAKMGPEEFMKHGSSMGTHRAIVPAVFADHRRREGGLSWIHPRNRVGAGWSEWGGVRGHSVSEPKKEKVKLNKLFGVDF
jgi:hypothetical protein